MFQKKLSAFVCPGVVATWLTVWIGDDLSHLSKADLSYFVAFYGLDNLRFSSGYVYGLEDFYD